MGNTIRYFRFGSETFRLMPNEEVAKAIISQFGNLNTDNDPSVLSDVEILEQIVEEDRPRAAAVLAEYATGLHKLAAVPTNNYSYERFKEDFSVPMYLRATSAPDIGIQASSTKVLDPRSYSEGTKKIEEIRQKVAERLANAKAYLRLWGGDLERSRKKYSPLFPPSNLAFAIPDVDDKHNSLGHRTLYKRLFFTDAAGEIRTERYFFPRGVAYFSELYSNELVLIGLAFIDHYREDIEKAATIVARHHPTLHRENIANIIAASFLEEMANLSNEDPVQDTEACLAVGCAVGNNMPTALGERYPARWKSLGWKAFNVFLGREKQGYGPGQIIEGLLKEAASDRQLLPDYYPHLTTGNFSDEESRLRTALDPKTFVYAKALTLDYILKKLEETLYKPPVDLKMPIDGVCPMEDPQASRERSMLWLARQLQTYPEISKYADLRAGIYVNPLNPYEAIWERVATLGGFPQNLTGYHLVETKMANLFEKASPKEDPQGRFDASLQDGTRVLYLDCK